MPNYELFLALSALAAQHQHHQAEGDPHAGLLGDYRMNQEASGTSWLPASSPHHALMLMPRGNVSTHLMGLLNTGYVDAGGKRGENQFYANSMLMSSTRVDTKGGTWGLRTMFSLDPLTNGKRGVPNLFQTGETLHGNPLVDRQHPHDLVAELAASFSTPIPGGRAFFYVAPIGEPALGGPMFMHRPSGMEAPEAPITHHWYDSTHVSFGVVTLGATMSDKWKVDASAFNGHEPDEDRYSIDPIALNAYSGRVSYNPNPNTSFQFSHGFLNSPEEHEPGVNVHRTTFGAFYNRPMANSNLAVGLMFGRNQTASSRSDAWNFEATWSNEDWSVFSRWENVEKDELVGVPTGSYRINKVVLGSTRNFLRQDGFEYGLGAYVGFYGTPSALKPFYGDSPVTLGVFLRIRPGRM